MSYSIPVLLSRNPVNNETVIGSDVINSSGVYVAPELTRTYVVPANSLQRIPDPTISDFITGADTPLYEYRNTLLSCPVKKDFTIADNKYNTILALSENLIDYEYNLVRYAVVSSYNNAVAFKRYNYSSQTLQPNFVDNSFNYNMRFIFCDIQGIDIRYDYYVSTFNPAFTHNNISYYYLHSLPNHPQYSYASEQQYIAGRNGLIDENLIGYAPWSLFPEGFPSEGAIPIGNPITGIENIDGDGIIPFVTPSAFRSVNYGIVDEITEVWTYSTIYG
jgi:hypothetical protein